MAFILPILAAIAKGAAVAGSAAASAAPVIAKGAAIAGKTAASVAPAVAKGAATVGKTAATVGKAAASTIPKGFKAISSALSSGTGENIKNAVRMGTNIANQQKQVGEPGVGSRAVGPDYFAEEMRRILGSRTGPNWPV